MSDSGELGLRADSSEPLQIEARHRQPPADRPAEASVECPAAQSVTRTDPPVRSEMTTTSLSQNEVNSPPGPGLFTALLWVLGVLVIHVGGIGIAVAALFATNLNLLKAVAANPELGPRILGPLLRTNAFFIIAGEMLVFVLVAVLLTRLKHGREMPRILGLRRFPASSLALIIVAVIPLSVLCSGLHEKALPVWDAITTAYPQLDVFGGLNVNRQLLPMGRSAPPWALLLVIAVAPAIGEELIFRGIIGNGLVARHGIVTGVFATSLYFAAVHLHPAHALTLMPLAIFMHIAWLSTRSFYAPVLIHFLNNGLAVFALTNASRLKEAAAESGELEAHWAMIAFAAIALIPAGIALWRSRIQFRLEDGSAWSPGYDTAASPPSQADARPVPESAAPWAYGTAIVLCGGISLLFGISTAMVLLEN